MSPNFNEVEPRLKSAKNRSQLSADLNLETLNTDLRVEPTIFEPFLKLRQWLKFFKFGLFFYLLWLDWPIMSSLTLQSEQLLVFLLRAYSSFPTNLFCSSNYNIYNINYISFQLFNHYCQCCIYLPLKRSKA